MHSRSQISRFNDSVAALFSGFEPEAFVHNTGNAGKRNALQLACAPFDTVRVVRGRIPARYKFQLEELEARGVKTPFQQASWLGDWQGERKGAFRDAAVTVIGYQSGRPVLALPLTLERGVFGTRLTWQCCGLSDYGAPVATRALLRTLTPADARHLLVETARALGGVDLICLTKTPEWLGEIANPFVLSDSVDYHAGAHALRLGRDWDSFYEGYRGARTRQSLKRKARSLEKMGEVRFRLAHTREEGEAIVKACLDMKIGQLVRSGHANPFASPATRRFLERHFAANLGRSTWAAALELDGGQIASAFGFRNSGEWLIYQLAMSDGPEARFSPGIHLLTGIMRHCVEAGVGRLDLALGDEAYKLEWCNEHIALKTTMIALTPTGRLFAAMIGGRAAVSAWLAQHPTRYRIAKRLKPKLAQLGIHV